jgi:16S rRNA (cytosine967-C5)-methyltransferase
VLRKLAASGEHLDYHAAVLESAPLWLRERITNSLWAAEMAALLGADARGGPAIALRLVKEPDPELLEQSEPGRASSRARLLKGQGDPRALPGYRDGKFVVQEEGAQLIALSLGARPGERILDACAGRGQKTSLLAEQIGGATLHAADCHPAKLGRLRDEFRRLGLAEPQVSAVDWTVGPGGVPGGFDRVLVDAPCTGVGTVRRRPELLGRLEPHDPSRLGALSLSVLRGAASRARSGGRVVFAVCSVFEEECEAVMAEVADLLEPAPIDVPEVDALVGRGATFGRLLPGRHGTDGYFIASFVRR